MPQVAPPYRRTARFEWDRCAEGKIPQQRWTQPDSWVVPDECTSVIVRVRTRAELPTSLESWERLPAALSGVCDAIRASRSLLDLLDDWDEAGSPAIKGITWQRAVGFLARYARLLWDRFDKVVETPAIVPGPDGSIDLHWKSASHELLVNIPVASDGKVGFYGDDYNDCYIKGKFDPIDANEGILIWLSMAT